MTFYLYPVLSFEAAVEPGTGTLLIKSYTGRYDCIGLVYTIRCSPASACRIQIHSIDNNQKISYKDMKFLMIAANVAAFAYTCVTGDATILAITIAWLWSVYGKSIYKAWYKFTRI